MGLVNLILLTFKYKLQLQFMIHVVKKHLNMIF